MPQPAARLSRLAILGASSLHGKELREVLGESPLAEAEVRLFDDESLAGTLTEAAGEPAFIQALDDDSFEGVGVAFFAGSRAFTERHWPQAHRAGAAVVDLTGALSGVPAAVPWIPALDAALPPPRPAVGKLFWSPASAAIIACTLAAALRKLGAARLAMVLFQPVSERGQAGVDELERQTVSLLSFQPVSREVFDEQVAFNLLSGYGQASVPALAEVRAEVAREAAAYLAGRAPLPAVQLVHAPVFYSYAFTAFVELEAARGPQELEAALTAAGARVAAAGEAAPSNVSVAGQGGIALGRVARDPTSDARYWLWGAADNVRLAALNAAAIAERLRG
jgi:aspartate-semialdehyde dehydrogenase